MPITYKSPNGALIVGTAERLTGVAGIIGIDPDTGKPEYEGYTEIDWNSQETVKRNDQIVYVDSEGSEWVFSELVLAFDNEAEDNT